MKADYYSSDYPEIIAEDIRNNERFRRNRLRVAQDECARCGSEGCDTCLSEPLNVKRKS